MIKIRQTPLADVVVIEPRIFRDERGFFLESYNARVWQEVAAVPPVFVQDNHSSSVSHTLRGLHYQIQQPQGKLVRVVRGAIQDVVVDLRRSSTTFGQWFSYELSADNLAQLWVPPGFAHGFLVLSDQAEVLYKATDYYAPQYERCIRWDDPDLAIAWQVSQSPIVSAKDQAGAAFRDADMFE